MVEVGLGRRRLRGEDELRIAVYGNCGGRHLFCDLRPTTDRSALTSTPLLSKI